MRQAVVLAGGFGTRLGELTRSTPKPLLPVGGRPFICWLVDELRRHAVEDIIVSAGFEGAQVAALFADAPDVRVIIEPEPLGTGGALALAANRLSEQFFFLNGDSAFDVNLWDLAQLAGAAPGAVALRRVVEGSRYGSVVLEGETITQFSERPGAPGPGLINGGVAVLSRALVERIPRGRAVSIEREVYPELASKGRLKGRIYDRPFIDIGVPEDFKRAQTWAAEVFTRGAVVFDRDGVLNADIGYAHRPEQIEWVVGAKEAVKVVNDAGLLALVATNQAGVARGYYAEDDVQALHKWMNDELIETGAHIDGFAYSPFHPEGVVERYRKVTDCRKPGPGLLLDLFDRHPVDRRRVMMIGDKPSDLAAAAAAGVRGVLFEGGDLAERVRPLVDELSRSVT